MSKAVVVAEKAHAELGASVASRWMPCPGSVQLIRQVPEGDKSGTSPFAREGTAAHAVAELALRKKAEPRTWEGMTIEGVEITDDMVDFVGIYTDYCRDLMARCGEGYYWIERKFNLAPLNPPGPMFGTADFTGLELKSIADAVEWGVLHVVDLKFGQGVLVEVRNNKQLRYYALGAFMSLPPELQAQVDEVEITIVQPRMAHPDGVIRSETVSVIELVEFANELMDAARATLQPNAPLKAGAHCKFCPASAICPAQREHAMELAQVDFDVVQESEFVPPAPETIEPEKFAEMLPRLPVLEAWIANMYQFAQAKLERGEDVPGFKMVAKRATRKWTDKAMAEQLAISALTTSPQMDGDLIEKLYEPRELKSPAQVEKVLGKKTFAATMSDVVVKQSSGYSMVPATDPRPAVALTAGEEFPLIGSGDNTAVPHEKQ